MDEEYESITNNDVKEALGNLRDDLMPKFEGIDLIGILADESGESSDGECILNFFVEVMKILSSVGKGEIKSADDAEAKYQAKLVEFDGFLTDNGSPLKSEIENRLSIVPQLIKKYSDEIIKKKNN